jgi:hypothetical protein
LKPHNDQTDEEGLSRDEIQRYTEVAVTSLLSLLEHCEELPEEDFISCVMIFNYSEAVKDFKPSNDFQTVMLASSGFNTKDIKQVLFATVFQSY